MSEQPLLIGLMGKARSGKDTFAKGLTERGYTRVAFADPLREMVERIDPIVSARSGLRLGGALTYWDGWEGVKDSPHGPEVRRLLQESGQSVRAIDPEFWIKAGLAKVTDAVVHGSGGAVITDVRYQNEAVRVRSHGGVLIRVVRPGLESVDTHSSEVDLDGYPADAVVVNDGTVDDLLAKARSITFYQGVA